MKTLILSLLIVSFSALIGEAQTKSPHLRREAFILETQKLTSTGHPDRALILWMINPQRKANGYAADDPYTCPDYSRGSYLYGPTRVSLIDTKTNAIVNTIVVAGSGGEATLDLPYAIRRGYYYQVADKVAEGVEAKPTIMRLEDYNGDGKALEFALFDAVACMGLQTALIGYSEKQDRAILYPIVLTETDGKKRSTRTTFWADYLFEKKPERAGFWKYEIDYRGRGGSLDQWQVNYNKLRERFEGTVKFVPDESN